MLVMISFPAVCYSSIVSDEGFICPDVSLKCFIVTANVFGVLRFSEGC